MNLSQDSFSDLDFPENLKLQFEIFKRSKVNLNDYYETCTYISIETSNNQEIINRMPYWVFNNYLVYMKKILTEKNRAEGGGGGEDTDATKQYSNIMGQSKNMYKNFSAQQNFSGMKNKFK